MRLEQAKVVARFVEDILSVERDASVAVVGDFNDTAGSASLAPLGAAGLSNSLETLVEAERYTSIYQGGAEAIDHIFTSPSLRGRLFEFHIAHVNADIVGAASDHDPVVARFTWPSSAAELGQGCSMVRAERPIGWPWFVAPWAVMWARTTRRRSSRPGVLSGHPFSSNGSRNETSIGIGIRCRPLRCLPPFFAPRGFPLRQTRLVERGRRGAGQL